MSYISSSIVTSMENNLFPKGKSAGTLQAVSSRMSRDGGVVVDDRSSDSRTVLWRAAWKRRTIRPSISNRRIAEYILHEILRCNTLMAHMQSFLIPTVRLCPASCRGLATQKKGGIFNERYRVL